MKIGNIETYNNPDFCALYLPPGLTCGVWIGMLREGEYLEWVKGHLGAVELIYPYSFHVQGKGIAIVPTFPVLDDQRILFVKPFALERLGTIKEERDQYTCEGSYNALFTKYMEMILASIAERSNLVLANAADLSRLTHKDH